LKKTVYFNLLILIIEIIINIALAI